MFFELLLSFITTIILRLEVLTALLVFWVVMPCGLVGGTDVSDECIASTFGAETLIPTHKCTRRHNPDDYHGA
jgi:hypothetical protein